MNRNDQLAAAKAAYQAAYAASRSQYDADRDHAALTARNREISAIYRAAERRYWDQVDDVLTAQARQDHRYDDF